MCKETVTRLIYKKELGNNYRFCGVEIVADYNCFDIFKNQDIAKDLENFPKYLENVFGL
jgi:modulator of drug activity B